MKPRMHLERARRLTGSPRRFPVVLHAVFAASLAVGCHSEDKPVAVKPANVPSEHPAMAPPPAERAATAPSEQPKAAAPAPDAARIVKAEPSRPAAPSLAAAQKLDARLAAAAKMPKEAAEPGAPPKLNPDIPIQDGDRALVEIEGTVSDDLLDQVKALGGTVVSTAEAGDSVRAMFPLSQLEALAGRPDVRSISPATLTVTRGARTNP